MRVLILVALLGVGLALFVAWDPGGRRGQPTAEVEHAAERSSDDVGDGAADGTRAGARLDEPTAPTAPAPTPRVAAERVDVPRTEPPRARRRVLGAVLGEGQPVPGAEIVLLAEGVAAARGTTDDQGRFEVSLGVPARDVVLRIVADGFAPFGRDLGNQGAGGDLRLGNLGLLRGRVLRGVVVGPDGLGVAGADVHLQAWWRSAARAGLTGDVQRTGRDGRFEFPLAPPGVVRLLATKAGYGERSVSVPEGEGREVRIELLPSLTLRISVRDPDERPVAGAQIQIRSSDPSAPPREASSDAKGSCVFEGLGTEVWNVRVSCTGYRPAGLSGALANDVPVAVELTRWPCVEGRVVTPDGAAVPARTTVEVLPAATRGDLVASVAPGKPVDDDGRFRLCDLRPGQYVLLVRAPGFAPTRSTSFGVGQKGDVSIGTIQLERGGALVFQLSTAGAPAPGVRAELYRVPPPRAQIWLEIDRGAVDPASRLLSDAAGLLRLDALAPGQVWAVLRGEHTVPQSVGPFVVRNDQASGPHAIDLELGRPIHGQVVDADGSAIGHARIHLDGPSLSIPFLESDSRGGYATPPVPPGRYSLVATHFRGVERRDSRPAQVEVSASSDGEVDIVFGE